MSSADTARQLAVAQAYADLQKWQSAADTLRPLLSAQTSDSRAWSLMARCQLALDRLDDAELCARRAAELAPLSEWPVRLLSIASRRRQQYAQARQCADRAVSLAPGAWQTHLERAAVDLDAKTVGPQTRQSIRTALELGPNEVEPHVLMGRLHLYHENFEESETSFREALRIDPSNAIAQNNLAAVALRRRRLRTAGPLLVSSLRADPQLAIAARNLDVLFSLWTGLSCAATVVASIIVNLFARHSVTVTSPGSSSSVIPGVTIPSFAIPGLTSFPAAVLPTITVPAVPTTGTNTVDAHGHTTALILAVCISVGTLVLCAVLVRRTIGAQCWRLIRRSCGTDRRVAALLTLDLGGVLGVVVAGSVGFPAALPICRAVLVTTVIVWFALIGRPRWRSARHSR